MMYGFQVIQKNHFLYQLNFVVTSGKFIIAKLSTRKLRSSSVLIVRVHPRLRIVSFAIIM